MTDDDPLLTADQAAERAAIAVKTWRSYMSRGTPRGNPVPHWDSRDLETGAQLWLASTVDGWIERRAGQGARTDLAEKKAAG